MQREVQRVDRESSRNRKYEGRGVQGLEEGRTGVWTPLLRLPVLVLYEEEYVQVEEVRVDLELLPELVEVRHRPTLSVTGP